jgi:hypothetical protein
VGGTTPTSIVSAVSFESAPVGIVIVAPPAVRVPPLGPIVFDGDEPASLDPSLLPESVLASVTDPPEPDEPPDPGTPPDPGFEPPDPDVEPPDPGEPPDPAEAPPPPVPTPPSLLLPWLLLQLASNTMTAPQAANLAT